MRSVYTFVNAQEGVIIVVFETKRTVMYYNISHISLYNSSFAPLLFVHIFVDLTFSLSR